jgi:hypothetical protein
LRDVTTVTDQGEFWEDREISVALNSAQMLFVNLCLRMDLKNHLSGLMATTGFIGSGFLPANYLHYSTGMVGPASDALRLAMIYVGGLAEVYRFNTRQQAIMIVGNELSFMDAGVQSSGQLWYYAYPSYIGLTALGDIVRADFTQVDFAANIYNDIITRWAAKIMGMKEPQTQREFKKHKRVMYEMAQYPLTTDNYIFGKDFRSPPKQEKTPNDGQEAQ